MTRQSLLKQILIGAGVVGAAATALLVYGVMTKNADASAIGGAIALAGLACAMNAHVALLRSGRPF